MATTKENTDVISNAPADSPAKVVENPNIPEKTLPENAEEDVALSEDPIMSPVYDSLKELMAESEETVKKNEEAEREARKEKVPDDAVVPRHLRKSEPEKPDEPEAPDAENREDPATETEIPEHVPVRARKEKPLTKDDLKNFFEEIKKPEKKEPEEKEEEESVDLDEELSEEDKDDLEFAQYAAAKMGDKYKELPKKLNSFYKRRKEFTEYMTSEHGNRFDEADPEYTEFVRKHYPVMRDIDRRKLDRQRIEDSVYAKLRKEQEAVKREFDKKAHRLEVQPTVDKTVTKFRERASELMAPPEDDPLRKDIFTSKLADAENIATAYLKAASGVDEWNPNKNQTHAWLSKFIDSEATKAEANGAKEIDGAKKKFVHPAKYAAMRNSNPNQAAEYWTWSHDDILDKIAAQAKTEAENEITQLENTVKKYGFTRGYVPDAKGKNSPQSSEPVRRKPPSSGPAPTHPEGNYDSPHGGEEHPADMLYELLPDMPKPGEE